MLFKHYRTLSYFCECFWTLLNAIQTLSNAIEHCWTPSNTVEWMLKNALKRYQTLSNATKRYWTLLNIADCYLNAFERFQTPSNITKLSRNIKLYKNAIEHAFKPCQMLLNTFEHCWLLSKRYQTLSNAIKLHQTLLSFRGMLNCVKMLSNTLSNAAKLLAHY